MTKPRSRLFAAALFASSCGAAVAGETGVTNMTFGTGHGTQVEYLAANGRSFLWYPGNRVVLSGLWRYAPYPTASASLPGICFSYGGNTYNPATGAGGGQWECEPLAIYRKGVVDAASGDPFGLSRRGAAPFDLPRDRTTMQALQARTRT